MRSLLRPTVPFLSIACLAAPAAASTEPWDVASDTWVATDALGRKLPGYRDCGPPQPGKVVGIFYFLWLGQHGTGGPYDISRLLAENPTSPAWGPRGAFHHWGESELGYYLSDDPFVIRRHCELLVDAMVDVVIFDVTNGYTYQGIYERLCSVYRTIRAEGGKTPQLCFLLHSSAATVAQKLYDDFYAKNLYPELWFQWGGKPLILASPEGQSAAVRAFFTFRESWAWSGSSWFGDGRDRWPWLDHYPQAFGWHTAGVPEEVPVCVAQHPTTNIGRSFHDSKQPAPGAFRTAEGLCFAEQWRRALEIDPAFIFVTGWNEWVAQRFISDGSSWFLGRKLPAGETYFVDQYNQEYSRDIEPMRGGHTDNYYYQLMGAVRRFKGVRKPEPPSPPATIAVDGDFGDWSAVGPEFRDTTGDTAHRDNAGWGAAGRYVARSGRNDFRRSKVARDGANLYFYAETVRGITSHTDVNWMLLFIDADASSSTGWFGYDYCVNHVVADATRTTLARYTAGEWRTVSLVPHRVAGNKLELSVPRADVGLAGRDNFVFDFHWSDNAGALDDIAAFFTDGDSAPNRRANYRYDLRCDTALVDPADCNRNGRPDACDLMLGASKDRNENRIPDECEELDPFFQRGDANADGALDLGDAIVVLNFLFLGLRQLVPCQKSADANDSGALDIADPVSLMAYFFAGERPPPAPFAACGADATADDLPCASFPPCGG